MSALPAARATKVHALLRGQANNGALTAEISALLEEYDARAVCSRESARKMGPWAGRLRTTA